VGGHQEHCERRNGGGGESNESAFKMARFLWNVQGKPGKMAMEKKG